MFQSLDKACGDELAVMNLRPNELALVMNDVRNLVVVGSAVFPSCPPSNPSLTVAALSLRAAELCA